MSKTCSRKEFIKISSLAGTGMLLAACGVPETEQKTNITITAADTNPPVDATIKPLVAEETFSVELIGEGDIRYDAFRKGFNKRIDKCPLLIALCLTAKDVSEAIRYANKYELEVAVKSGGHSLEGFSSNDGGMVIDVSR